jgi:hypothetical protein
VIKAPFPAEFFGPSDPHKRGPDKNPYIMGLKRSLSRWDDSVLPWAQFDEHYNAKLEGAIKVFKSAHGISSPKYEWGSVVHKALENALRDRGRTTPHDPAIDRVALNLMEDGYDMVHPPYVPTALEKVQNAITNYLIACEQNAYRIHYLQQRPMRSLGVDPSRGFYGDCSELCVAALYWARTHTGIHVPDPAGYGFEGYGNSVTLYSVNRSRRLSLSANFMIGDIALYGPYASRHATICRQPGTMSHAIFTSHGSEAGPYATRANYRGDLYAIVRPILVP